MNAIEQRIICFFTLVDFNNTWNNFMAKLTNYIEKIILFEYFTSEITFIRKILNFINNIRKARLNKFKQAF